MNTLKVVMNPITKRDFIKKICYFSIFSVPFTKTLMMNSFVTHSILDWTHIFDKEFQAVQIIGNKYLENNPQEKDSKLLEKLIFKDMLVLNYSFEKIKIMIEENIMNDYEYGATEILHQWLFSKTELRLCGLIGALY